VFPGVLGERDPAGARPAPEFRPFPVPGAAAADRAGEEERVVRARDADEGHHGISPVPAGSSSTSPQNQSVPSSSRTGWAAAQFFPWQRTTPRGPDMRGQTFRSDMVPSPPSRHIRHLRFRDPAREHAVPVPCFPVGTDPEVEGPAGGPGDGPQFVDLPVEQGRNIRGIRDCPPCRDHAVDVDAARLGPGDQAGWKRGVGQPDDDFVPPVTEHPPGLVLCDPAAVASRPQG